MSTGKIELSVGAVKYVDPNEIITEEEYNYIKNKVPELDGRVGDIEDEIEEINTSLDDIVHLCKDDSKEGIESFINNIDDNSKILINGIVSDKIITIRNKKNITLEGNNTKLTGRTSFHFVDCENITVQGFDSNNYTGNATFVFTDCIGIKVCNNNFKNTPSFAIRLIRNTNKVCKDIIISNNTFENISTVDTWAGAIYIDGQGKKNAEDTRETLPIENMIISNNTFRNIGTGAVNLGGAKNVTISNNIFDSSYGAQSMLITINRESTDITITGNTFKKVGWESIVVNFSNNVAIIGNYFEDFGYGVQIETGSKKIIVSSNIFVGKKDNRTFITSNMQQNTYSIGIINSENVIVSSNLIDDCTNGIIIGKNSKNVSVSENNIVNSSASITVDQSGRENISITNNVVKNCISGILANVDFGYLKIENNSIKVNSSCIQIQTSPSNVIITIKNNFCDGGIAIDNSMLYNGDAYFEIINNTKTSATIPYKKYGIQHWSGYILWDNPTFVLNKDLIVERFVKGSKVNFDESTFNSKPTGLSSALGYYLAKSENGVIFLMSDNTWKKKTGGGGSTMITTKDW